MSCSQIYIKRKTYSIVRIYAYYATLSDMSSDILSIQEEIFKVIGNQKRLEILLLLENRELNVSEMIEMLGLRQSNLSQHLTLLRAQHLVEVRKHGRESFYSLADNSIAVAIRSIHDFLRKTHRIDAAFDSNALFPIVTDPICGMRFSASKAFSHINKGGKLYHFCASGCESAFKNAVKLTAEEPVAHLAHA